jgi:hypothetical protein
MHHFLENLTENIRFLQQRLREDTEERTRRYGPDPIADRFELQLTQSSGPITIAFTQKHKGKKEMNLLFKKGYFVVFTAIGANSTNPKADITNFTAVASDPTILQVVVSGSTATITSLADGAATVAYGSQDINGNSLPGFTDQFTISDVDDVATSFSGTYTQPAPVVPPAAS